LGGFVTGARLAVSVVALLPVLLVLLLVRGALNLSAL
jgi:hypothetical protein